MLACMLLAVDPRGLGGAVLRGPGGPARDAWLETFRQLLPEHQPIHKLPPHIAIDRLLGGLDVAATLKSGKPVLERGLLASTDDGVLVATSCERLTPDKAALLAAAMDGVNTMPPSLIACDEGVEDDECAPRIVIERVAFMLQLGNHPMPHISIAPDVLAARAGLVDVTVPHYVTEALCQTAMALGITSMRPVLFALRAARVSCAIDGRATVDDDDAATAARLVLAPRATIFPQSDPRDDRAPEDQGQQESASEDTGDDDQPSPQELAEIILDAIKPALPSGLLNRLAQELAQRQSGKSGAGTPSPQSGIKRGRPAGTRKGDPRQGARLNLIETLRAAAPWQRMRKLHEPDRRGIRVERSDFRINRYKQRHETTAIFIVDASGSAALNRMAEAKGAVELILADCYVRRDRTALIAFRGRKAEVLLPPTRSLQRARRSLADLPGGGGTPLGSAIDCAILVAEQVRRGGGTPLLVFLTDGRANIARDGSADRASATRDAHDAARNLRACGHAALMIDLSEAHQGAARQLADVMAATYLPLPYADASIISQSVGIAMKAQGPAR